MTVRLCRSALAAFVYDEDLSESKYEGAVYLAQLVLAQMIVLDRVGRVIWELLEEPQSLEALITQVARAFEEPAETVEAGVRDFVDQLLKQELLVELSPQQQIV
ncbi:MAG: PqqD family protein [Rothia sp. (in: high G+C Gram-positive bacteria)]|nr:PqqD family protein [Rothia sp. (in: high G+C Gram-positive bacteria)]